MKRTALALVAALLTAGCGIGPPQRPPVVTYDLGPAIAGSAPAEAPVLGVPRADAPPWLDTAGIVYRLAYADAQSPRVYAGSRWVAEFPDLFTARLRQHLAGAWRVVAEAPETRPEQVLRVQLEEVAQVFDAPAASRGVLQVRGSLYRGGKLLAQHAWTVEEPGPSADAAGGARALAAASDRAVAAIAAWLAEQLPRSAIARQ